MRCIITHLEMDYLKKALGSITAECRAPVIVAGERREYDVQADLTDESGEVVARARARWRLGPATHRPGLPRVGEETKMAGDRDT